MEELKQCNKCMDTFPRSIEHFRKHKQKKDGLHPTCKTCLLNREREGYEKRNAELRERWRDDEEYRDKRKSSANKWKSENRKKLKEWQEEYFKKHPQRYTESAYNFRKEYPEKAKILSRVGGTVHRAIKKGLLSRPNICVWCNQEHHRIEAAHHDYSLPLDILWLCPSCHGKWDKELPKLIDDSEQINIVDYFYGEESNRDSRL